MSLRKSFLPTRIHKFLKLKKIIFFCIKVIIGYVGEKEAYDFINGLERLEYRGHDSAGIASIDNNRIQIKKVK